MPHVALMTIGLLRAPWGDPLVRGFEERVDEIFATAAACPGFVARLGAVERGALDGGPPVVTPAFAGLEDQDRIPKTFSVWRDAESAFAFSYHGIHGAALRDRHAWFSRIDAPSHVAWWIDEGHLPTRAEAAARYTELASSGPSAGALPVAVRRRRARLRDRPRGCAAPCAGPATLSAGTHRSRSPRPIRRGRTTRSRRSSARCGRRMRTTSS